MAIASSGSGSYLFRNADLLDYNAAYTMMAWFNHINASRAFLTILTARNTTNNQDSVLVDDSTSGFILQTRVGGVQTQGANYSTSYGWNHVAMRRNSATSLDLVLNGDQAANITPDVSARVAQTESRIGNGFVHPFMQMFVYNAALSDEQIQDQMYFSYPRRTANLREWVPMESGSARNVDFSGNNRDYTELGTLNNADGLLLARSSLLISRRVVTPTVYNASPLGMLMTNF